MDEVEITPEGLRQLNRLPDKVRHAALATIFGPIAENSQRLGKPLVGELEGLSSARRGDYRIIYETSKEKTPFSSTEFNADETCTDHAD